MMTGSGSFLNFTSNNTVATASLPYFLKYGTG